MKRALPKTKQATEKASKGKGFKPPDADLRESESRYRLLFETARDGILLVDAKTGEIVDVNPSLMDMLGYTRVGIVGRKVWDIHANPEAARKNFEKLRKIKEARVDHIELRKRDGQLAQVECVSNLYAVGKKKFIQGNIRDISKRRKAEESLRASEKRLAALIEHSRDNISLLDGEGRLLWESPSANFMLGYETGEFIGQNIFELIHPEDRGWTGELFAQAARAAGSVEHGTFRLRHRNGSWRWVEATAVNRLDIPEIAAIIINYRDVTEKITVEESLRESERRLESLFDNSPIPIWEEDFSEVRKYLKQIKLAGKSGEAVRKYVARHPDLIEQCVERVRIINVNRACLALHNAADKSSLLKGLGALVTEESREALLGQIAAIAGGKTQLEKDSMVRTLDGQLRHVHVHWSVVPGYEDSLERVIVSTEDISQRIEAEKAQRASESRFRSLIENSQDAIALLDATGKLIYESPSGLQITGYSAEERIGGGGFDLIHPDDLGNVRQNFGRVMQKPGADVRLQVRSRRRDGGWRWLDVTAVNLLADPAVGAIVVNYRDITERRQAEDALKQSEEKFFKAFHASPDAVLITRMTNGQIVEVNEGFYRITEYSIDEAIGRTTVELGLWLEAADRETFISLMQKDGHVRDREFKYRVKSGRVIDALLSAEMVFIGGEQYLLGIVRDITERKQAEEMLKASENRFRSLIENSHDAVAMADRYGVTIYDSPAVERITGYSLAESVGRNSFTVLHPDDQEHIKVLLAQIIRDPLASVRTEFRWRHKDGHWIWIEAVATNLLEEPGVEAIVINYRDATERKNSEGDLRREKGFSDAIINSMPGIFYLFDTQGKFLRWNENFEKVSGYSAAEIAAMHPTELFEEPEKELIRQRIGRVFETGYSFAEANFASRDGSRTPYYFTGVRVELNGQTCLLGVGVDITERRRAEKMLTDLSRAVNASGDIVFMTDKDGMITSVNSQFSDLYGYSPDEVVGKTTPRILKSGKQGPEVYKNFWAMITRGELFRGEVINKAKDGRLIPIEETVNPFFDERGEIAGFLAIQRNIAERRQAEEALRESEERYRLLAETSQDSITVINRDYVIEYTNTFAAHQFGIPAQTLIGKRLTDIFPPDIASRQQSNLQKVFENGQPFYIEAPAKFQDMMRWLSTWLVPIRDKLEQTRAILIVSRDITERRQAEESLRLAEAKYRALVENIPAIVYMDTADETSANLYISPYVERMLGYPASAYIEDPTLWYAQIDPRDYPRAIESIHKTLAEGFAVEEYRFVALDGRMVWARDSAVLIRGEDGHPRFIQGFIEDITAKKQAEERIAQSLRELTALHSIGQSLGADITLERVVRSAVDGTVDATQADAVMFFLKTERGLEIQGFGPGDSKFQHDTTPVLRAGECLCGLAAQEGKPVYSFNIHTDIRCTLSKCKQAGIQSFASLPLVSEGEIIGVLGIASAEERNFEEQALFLEAIAASASISLRNALLYEKVKSHAEELEREIVERKRAEQALVKSERDYRYLFNNAGDAVLIIEPQSEIILQANATACRLYGFEHREIVGKSLKDLTRNVGRGETYLNAFVRGEAPNIFESTHINKDGREIEVLINSSLIEYEGSAAVLALVRDVTERRQAQEALRKSEARLSEAQQIAHLGNWEWDITKNSIWWSDETYRIFGLSREAFEATVEAFLETIHPDDRSFVMQALDKALYEDTPYDLDHRILLPDGTEKFVHEQAVVERDDAGKPIRMAGISFDITERKRAEANIQKQLSHLRSLREIDMAITSGFDMQINLNTLLRNVTSELGVDATDILLLAPELNLLEFAAGHGFRGRGIRQSSLMVGEGFAGRAALERVLVHIADLNADPSLFSRARLLADEKFICYFGVPLIAKGMVKGILEIFHRAPLDPDQDWFDLFHTLAGQAAIAVENAQLFGNLQQSNMSLLQAYDSTIEGWSRALDLRDKETEGHTLRVTDTAIRLGQKLGLRSEELKHMRWGGLLHDIGKMGVPDAILFKNESLDHEELETMRKHPALAYEMISPIQYLKPALDIPYCHHERWDGAGYPRGLKGEEIPLAARIFAVADVYDALTSDRPYRSRWTKRQAIDYIRENSGSHFDPQVVNAFIEMFGGDDMDQ